MRALILFAVCAACSSSASHTTTRVEVIAEAGTTVVVERDAGSDVREVDTWQAPEAETDAGVDAVPEAEPEVDAAPEAAPCAKECSGVCVGEEMPEYGCASDSCDVCPRPADSNYTCVDGECAFFCTSTWLVVKNGTCALDSPHQTGSPNLASCGGAAASNCPSSCPADRHCCMANTACGCWDGVQCK